MRTGNQRRIRGSLSRRPGGDEGAALVTVIGLALVMAIILVTIATATLFSIRTTVTQRGMVQAQARAEAGVDGFVAWLAAIDPAVGCVGGAPLSGTNYAVSGVTYYNASGAVVPSVNSCPPTGATVVELTSVGTVSSATVQGTANSARQMTARVTLGATTTPSPLSAAVFSQANLQINGELSVASGAAGAGDVYTNGTFGCSNNGTVTGSLFAKGAANLVGCDFLENVVAYGGGFSCSTAAQVTGDIYAAGPVTFSSEPCSVGGNIYAQGSFVCSNASQVGGLISAQGDITFSSNCRVNGATYATGNLSCGGGMTTGDIYVGGTASLSNGQCKVNGRLHTGGLIKMPSSPTVTGDVISRNSGLEINSLPNIGGSVRLGGTMTAGYWATQYMNANPGKVLQNQVGLAAPTAPPSAPAALTTFPSAEFPQRTESDAAWTRASTVPWNTLVQPYLTQGWANACSNQANLSGAVVLAADTLYDARTTCPGGLTWSHGDSTSNFIVNGNATIRATSFNINKSTTISLKGDLVIMADSISLANGGLTVVSGDGQKHNLYIVNPWSPSAQCTSTSTASSSIALQNSITFDPVVSVLFYTPGTFTTSASTPGAGKLPFTGQVYGCKVTISTTVAMTYDSVGGSTPGAVGAMHPVVEWKRDT